MGSHDMPSPKYPVLQLQLNDPSVLWHSALTLHTVDASASSITSGSAVVVVVSCFRSITRKILEVDEVDVDEVVDDDVVVAVAAVVRLLLHRSSRM